MLWAPLASRTEYVWSEVKHMDVIEVYVLMGQINT